VPNRGFEVIRVLKSNRVVYIKSQCKRKKVILNRLGCPGSSPGCCEQQYLSHSAAGRLLKGQLKATILTTEVPGQRTKYLTHFQREGVKPLSSMAIINHYVNPWPIETFHRTKQRLGFDDYRLHSLEGIKHYLEILLIAYTVTENHRGLPALEEPDHPLASLYDVCR